MFARRLLVLIFIAAALSACLAAFEKPKVDREKALLAARVRFLETHPGRTGVEGLGEEDRVYVVSYNITDAQKEEIDFAEYYVDKYTGAVYASARYSLALAIKASPEVRRIFERYKSPTTAAALMESPDKVEPTYVWEINIIAEGVNVFAFRFDALNERMVAFYDKQQSFNF